MGEFLLVKDRCLQRPTSNGIDHHSNYYFSPAIRTHSLLIGDALYFPSLYIVSVQNGETVVIKYDFHVHRLSEVDIPQDVYRGTLMMNEDGGLGLATLKKNCIYLWSRQDVTNGNGGWVEHIGLWSLRRWSQDVSHSRHIK